jgi:hypothetical protein
MRFALHSVLGRYNHLMRFWALLPILLCVARAQPPDLAAMTTRLSEEAEVFAHTARSVLSEENLKQRTRKPVSRFRPRILDESGAPPKEEFTTREIVSEYGYSSFQDSPGAIHEFRTVISVDGRKLQAPEKARRTLTLGIASADDNVKKQLLKDFENHGLTGAVTDFGQLILLFTKRRIPGYKFEISGQSFVGADVVAVVSFEQKSGDEALTIFSGREALRQTLKGSIWLRVPDYAPLRIQLASTRPEGNVVIKTEATVDYAMSSHGCVLPASVIHRETVGEKLLTENVFQYASFRKFGAESELKFTETPAAPLE